MPKLSVYDLSGAQTGEIELNDSVFGAEFNELPLLKPVLWYAVAVVNPGNKKVLAALVAVPTVLPYGLAVVPLLVPNPAAMQRKCLVKHVA